MPDTSPAPFGHPGQGFPPAPAPGAQPQPQPLVPPNQDPNQATPGLAVPPGPFTAPAAQPWQPPAASGPQPPALSPQPADQNQWVPGLLRPPGMFVSPGGLPLRTTVQAAPATTSPFPAVPGRFQPGLATPGSPGLPQAVPPAPPAPPAVILQQVPGRSTFDYGLSSIEVSTTVGSGLVLLAGWDLSTAPTTAAMPRAEVTDSAGNYWRHVTTSTSGVSGARCCAWVCPNAMAISWLTVSLSTFGSSLAYLLVEVNGAAFPQHYSLDAVDVTAATSAASLVVNPGVTSAAGFSFALLAAGALPAAPTLTGGTATWTALSPVTAGTGPNPAAVFPYVSQTTPGTALATTFTLPQAVPLAGLVFALRPGTAPVQTNPNFPAVRVEVGFGSVPGDPSQPPPAWTDISNRVVAPLGGTWFDTQAGHQYELATPEAGTIEVLVDNHDGALTPGNSASPFFPNVVAEVPLHILVSQGGRWYALATGWVERWPQEWPDLPQWGLSKVVATDAISVLAAVNLPSALDGDTLLNAPYVYLTAAEQYLSFSNGLSGGGSLGSFAAADAEGLAAQNSSRVNQRAGVYVDGVGAVPGSSPPAPATAQTGQSTNLLGSAQTGFGTSAFSTTAPTAPVSGPGIVYADPNMPGPLSPAGVTVSFWVVIPAAATAASLQPVLFSAWGTPSSYQAAHPSLQVLAATLSSTLKVTLADGSSVGVPFSPSASPQQVTLSVTASGLTVYVNGAQEGAFGLSPAQATAWSACALGCPNYAWGAASSTAGNFTAFGLAVYPGQLPVQRVVANYATGITGQQGVDATARLAQVMSWGNLAIARAGRATFNGIPDGVTQGPAYSLAGSTASAALAQLVVNHQAMAAAWPTGAAVYLHKWALLNQNPVAAFGDTPVPPPGMVPYLQSQKWDYDNTYLWNTITIAQSYGQNTLFSLTGTVFSSVASYFARTAPAQTLTTMSSLDVPDAVNWSLTKYSQPSLRVSGVTIDAAAHPAAFPVVLPLMQGQAVSVTRMPVGGAAVSGTVLVQRVRHQVGPNLWKASYQLSPYTIESSVLQLDSPQDGTVGGATLA